jgi:hypothetical protein
MQPSRLRLRVVFLVEEVFAILLYHAARPNCNDVEAGDARDPATRFQVSKPSQAATKKSEWHQ